MDKEIRINEVKKLEDYTVMRTSAVRKDAVEKVTGSARYIQDIKLPGMLHAKYLRCPHAHARIKRIDTAKAEALPGVRCILTYKNVPKRTSMRKLNYLLGDTFTCPGEEVAAVAATTPEIAERALKLIEVEYEVLPAVFNAEEAMKPDAPLVNEEYGTNIYHGTPTVNISRLDPADHKLKLDYGDPDKGFEEADYIVENDDTTPVQYPCSPMPRGVVCEWVGDKLNCWADCQLPLYLLADLSKNLEIPQSAIHLVTHYVVGGYGGKSPEKTATLTAIMSQRTGKPVRSVFSRAEDFIGTHHRISYRNFNRMGVSKDGRIVAREHKTIADWGYDTVSHYICQGTALTEGVHSVYSCPNTRGESIGVLTNTLGYSAMNGFGGPEIMYSVDKLADMAAEKLDMDPVEFRLKNAVRYGDRAMEYEQSLFGPVNWGILGPDMDSFPEMIRMTAEKANWKEKWKGWKTPMSVNGSKRRGIGIGIGMHHTAYWPSSATVKMSQDGTATVQSGAVEIGQGYATIICQIVAESLGLRYEDVNPMVGDTSACPASRGNVASTGTSSAANACKLAADDAKRQIFEFAAKKLDVSPDQLEARDRKVWVKGTDRFLTMAEICTEAWQIVGFGKNPAYFEIKDEKTGKTIHAYAGAVCIAEVEVDVETGKLDVLKMTCACDSGVSINPLMVENQMDLSIIMGSGWARTEAMIFDQKTGVVLNPNLLDYKVLTALDMPKEDDYQRIIVEKPSAWGPYGAKGFSETPITPVAPALANAIYNAIGVRVYEDSLQPDTILKTWAKRESEK